MKADDIEALGASILRAADATGGGRLVVAIAGAPGSGKSTLAARLQTEIERRAPALHPVLFPMDGFHLDNAILEQRGLLAKKGAPETFDAAGYLAALARIRAQHEDVLLPSFDRNLDLARAGAIAVEQRHRVVLTEGNYLLADAPPWDRVATLIDLGIFVDIEFDVLEQRLVQRWLDHGLAPDAARARALGNDIPNARYVAENSRGADIVIGEN